MADGAGGAAYHRAMAVWPKDRIKASAVVAECRERFRKWSKLDAEELDAAIATQITGRFGPDRQQAWEQERNEEQQAAKLVAAVFAATSEWEPRLPVLRTMRTAALEWKAAALPGALRPLDRFVWMVDKYRLFPQAKHTVKKSGVERVTYFLTDREIAVVAILAGFNIALGDAVDTIPKAMHKAAKMVQDARRRILDRTDRPFDAFQSAHGIAGSRGPKAKKRKLRRSKKRP